MPYTLTACGTLSANSTHNVFMDLQRNDSSGPAQVQVTVLIRHIGLVLLLYSIFQRVFYSAGQVTPDMILPL